MNTLDKLREAFHDLGAEAMLVTHPANVRYLSSFTSPEDGRVLVTSEEAVLYTDGRYTAQVAEESRLPVEIVQGEWLTPLSEKLQGRALAIEAEHLSYQLFSKLAEKLGREPLPSSGLVSRFRLTKTPAELARLRQAAELTDAAYTHILDFMKPGCQEVEVTLELERFIRKAGAEGKSFDFIAASGVRSAMPHGGATNKELANGELVTLDFGAVVDGYHADMTRTVAIGEVSEELRRMYEAVLEANQTALAALAPGKNGKEVDALARAVLAEYELDEYFTHSLGHGVGLEVHEGPRLAKTQSQMLEPNMTATIEPGIYIPGKAGVRVEDLAVITGGGYELLSHSDKAFTQL